MLVRLDDAELKLRVEQAVAQVEQAKRAVRQAEEKNWFEIGPGVRSESRFGSRRGEGCA